VIEDSTFAWNGQRGMSIHDAPNARIRGNVFAGNSRVGLRASRTRRLRVENNLFAWNNVDRWRMAWDAGGVKITNMAYGPKDGLMFRGNVAENNFSTGVWLDIDVNDAVVVHNIARRNQAIGLFFEISDTAIIAFNVSYENGMGVMISNARNARVWNNTLVNNANNIPDPQAPTGP
jgi:nitrous oxidase accessory protein NosD